MHLPTLCIVQFLSFFLLPSVRIHYIQYFFFFVIYLYNGAARKIAISFMLAPTSLYKKMWSCLISVVSRNIFHRDINYFCFQVRIVISIVTKKKMILIFPIEVTCIFNQDISLCSCYTITAFSEYADYWGIMCCATSLMQLASQARRNSLRFSNTHWSLQGDPVWKTSLVFLKRWKKHFERRLKCFCV